MMSGLTAIANISRVRSAPASAARFRFSERAKAELLAIYADREARFGPYQAEAYHAGLDRIFGLPADFPRIIGMRARFAPGIEGSVFRPIS